MTAAAGELAAPAERVWPLLQRALLGADLGASTVLQPGAYEGIYRLAGQPRWGPAGGVDGFLRLLDADELAHRISVGVALRELTGTGRIAGILRLQLDDVAGGSCRLTTQSTLRVTARLRPGTTADLLAAALALSDAVLAGLTRQLPRPACPAVVVGPGRQTVAVGTAAAAGLAGGLVWWAARTGSQRARSQRARSRRG